MEPYVLNEGQYREMSGDLDSHNESFYGFQMSKGHPMVLEEEGLGLQENFPSEGSGCREGAMIGVYRFDSQLKDVMEDAGVKANLRDSPPHL